MPIDESRGLVVFQVKKVRETQIGCMTKSVDSLWY